MKATVLAIQINKVCMLIHKIAIGGLGDYEKNCVPQKSFKICVVSSDRRKIYAKSEKVQPTLENDRMLPS